MDESAGGAQVDRENSSCHARDTHRRPLRVDVLLGALSCGSIHVGAFPEKTMVKNYAE